MIIEGHRGAMGTLFVTVNGEPLTPEASLRVVNHSPTGFECGYAGSGPAQLALALLLRAGLSRDRAVWLHQPFKRQFVQYWHAPFTVTVDVGAWVASDRART